MPVLNGAVYLRQAIQSVLRQDTTSPWELLIIDDGSTDGSIDLARRYAAIFPDRIHVLRHPDGGTYGASAARNLGLDHATGKVIAFLDADDVWLPHMLSAQLALLAQHPQAAMVYANAERTWDMTQLPRAATTLSGENQLPALLPDGVQPGLLAMGEPLCWFLEDETLTPCTCTVLVRAEAARSVCGFVESFHGLYDDQAFYAKLVLTHRVAVSTEVVARYRQHAVSCCARGWRDRALQTSARRNFEAWLNGYRVGLQVPEHEETLLLAAD